MGVPPEAAPRERSVGEGGGTTEEGASTEAAARTDGKEKVEDAAAGE